MAAVREGRGAVAVLRRDGEGRDLARRRVDDRLRRVVHARLLVILHLLEEFCEGLAEVGRDDSRRRLHGAEAEVVARSGDRHAHEVRVGRNRLDDGGHDAREGLRVVRHLRRLRAVEEVDARVCGEREVVVLARAVDALEGLLVEEADEVVLDGDLLDELHHH